LQAFADQRVPPAGRAGRDAVDGAAKPGRHVELDHDGDAPQAEGGPQPLRVVLRALDDVELLGRVDPADQAADLAVPIDDLTRRIKVRTDRAGSAAPRGLGDGD